METIQPVKNSFLLDDLLDQKSIRDSALERAASITPLVTSVTIGPNSSFREEVGTESPPQLKTPVASPQIKEKSQKIEKTSPVTVADLQLLQQKMRQQSDDRKLKEDIRKKMEARIENEQMHYEKVKKMLESLQLETEKKHKAKLEKMEREIENVLRIEEQEEQAYQRQRAELAKNARKVLEQQERDLREKKEKHERDLKTLDENFGKLEGSFNKIVAACSPDMSHITKLYQAEVDDLKSQMNSNRSSLDSMKIACVKLDETCKALFTARRDFEEQSKVALAKKQAEEIQAAADAQARADAAQKAAVVPTRDQPDNRALSVQAIPVVRSENGRFYNELMQFLNDKENATMQLSNAQDLEKFRFALKMAVNGPINLLENKSSLMTAFQKLQDLLSGQPIETSKGRISTNNHAEASSWVQLRIAEKLMDVCDKKPTFTFFIAALTLALWQKFPEFGKVFQAKLYKECPFLLPYVPPHFPGQTDTQFLASWGYRRAADSDDKSEDYKLYEQRTSQYAALLASIWISMPKRDEQSPHPCSIDSAWKYLSDVLNSRPDPMYLHLLDKVLETAGSTMHRTYGNHLVKLLLILQKVYLPAIQAQAESEDQMKAIFNRLQAGLSKFFKQKRFDEPKGMLPGNYW